LRPAALLIGLGALLLTVGCGTEPASQSTSSTSEAAKYTTRPWFDARYADSSRAVVVLTYLKPTGEGCEERAVGRVAPVGDLLRAEVRVEEPWAPESCELAPGEIEVDLGGPLGGRRLRTPGSDTTFVDRDGSLEIDPASTPCGRRDCSQPAPDPSPCTDEVARTAVEREVDGADPAITVRACDGSFLVADLTIGAGGCPPDHRSDCARPQRAYLVAREADWRLLTYGRDMTCEDVYRVSALRLPIAVCPPA
jgi:hypothetical protein